MAIERAVVKGMFAGIVNTRSMFTCEVVPQGGDTSQVLWNGYLGPLYTEIQGMTSTLMTTQSYEIQSYSFGHWVLQDEVTFENTGDQTGEAIANIVSIVLIGKANGLRKIGRKFFGPIAESSANGNNLTGPILGVAGNALLAYVTPFTGIGGGTITPGILDKNSQFHPFVGGFVSSLLGSMRKRKPGVGI